MSREHLQSFDALVAAAGLKPDEFFRSLRKDLSATPDPIRAANNFHRFLSSGFSSALLHDFQRHPVLRTIALELFSQSQYLADILVRDPELFRWLTTTPALKTAKSKSALLQEAANTMQLFTRPEKKLDALKRFHRREILRIGARDILNEADIVLITQELSDLADAITACVLQVGLQELVARTGAAFESTLTVIGLGKLGGRELNFSSDIDLLFLYDEDGEFDAPQERIRTYHEFYNRLAEFVVRRLTEATSEGHLYRVDMRLRPEGGAGPLALSRSASIQYYETRGSLWERQMLIKARAVAGHRRVAEEWMQTLQPFVFPRTFLKSPLAEISEMKRRIEEKPGVDSNIKLGSGGIRDIEFIVQALQLLNGGGDVRLREPNTLESIRRLVHSKRLHTRDAAILSAAYRFFRILEHRLQLLHGAQTHSLPETPEERELLARRLGYSSGSKLAREIDAHRKRVRTIFDLVFAEKETSASAKVRQERKKKVAFLRSEESNRILQSLRESILEGSGEEKAFLDFLSEAGAPDWGIRNFALLAESPPLRRTLAQAVKNHEMLKLIVFLCSRSKNMTLQLSREPLLFESLGGQPEEFFREETGWAFLREHDAFRYKQYNEFRILLPFVLKQSPLETMTERLSTLAEDIVNGFLRTISGSEYVALGALGKLGGREITVGSDLDLVAFYRQDQASPEAAERIVTSFVKMFSDGSPYVVDFRLRPEGKSAPLATELQYYREYLRSRASLWERQSLTKARTIAGHGGLGHSLEELWAEATYGASLPDRWVEEIRRMRRRTEVERPKSGQMDLKVGRGGIMDLEFLVQMLVLSAGRPHPSVRQQNSLVALGELQRLKIVAKSVARTLRENLVFFRTLETAVRLNSTRTEFLLPSDVLELQAVAAFMGEPTGKELRKRVEAKRRENRLLFQSLTRRLAQEKR